MRVLIVEDDQRVSQSLAGRIGSRIASSRIVQVECLSKVESALDGGTFDGVIVDLRIPSAPGAGDAAIEFGLKAEVLAREAQPGAMRVFLTAFDSGVVVDPLRLGRSDDFFLTGEVFGLVDYIQKDSVDSLEACVEKLEEHWNRLRSLDEVDLANVGDVDEDVRRALALGVRVAGGSKGTVLRRPGKSGATTALLECLHESSGVTANAFCKVGSAAEIDREEAGYRLAEYRLSSTSCPKLGRTLDVGVGRGKALVYTSAPSTKSFFDLAGHDPASAGDVVSRLPAVFSGWHSGGSISSHRMSDLISNTLSAESAARFSSELGKLGLPGMSDANHEMRSYCQHGDLHGENMFVLDSGDPFLIDFAHTRVQPGPVDAVSLELSLLFHDSSPIFGLPSKDEYRTWFESPRLPEVVSNCRSWAKTVGHTPTEYGVVALLYCLWIIKYANDAEEVIALAESALEVIGDASRLAHWD